MSWFKKKSKDYDEVEFEEDYEEGSGVYRSYEEYLESGEEIDPCDDALWLHDQE